MIKRLPTLVLAATLLAGCQTLGDFLPSLQQDGSANAVTGEGLKDGASVSDSTESDDQTAALFTAPVDDNPQQFMGLGTEAVLAALGDPDLTRRDGPAEVRQFRGQDCVLDLFMYPASGELSVRHVELRGPTLSADARRACLAEMIRSRSLTG